MLEVDAIETWYGHCQALHGVSLAVAAGEVVTLLGRNGMGKTTTIRSIIGLTPPRRGRVLFDGREVQRMTSFRIARLGLGLVPEGRQIFPTLTVYENLVATAIAPRRGRHGGVSWDLAAVYELLPRLRERERQMGSTLSGGEQQMLAIGRALMTNPLLLMLDEATEGLAPLVREEIWSCLRRLKQAGQSILLIDKNLRAVLGIADRHYIVEKGRSVWAGSSAELAAEPGLGHRYLGV